MKKRFFGWSNAVGFFIYEERDDIRVETAGIKSVQAKINRIIVTILFFTFVVSVIYPSAMMLFVAFYIFSKTTFLKRKIWAKTLRNEKEWHAAEHKLIHLLYFTTDVTWLTMENLKRTSMYSPCCGSGNTFLIEPSKDKLEESLRVGREYYKKLKGA